MNFKNWVVAKEKAEELNLYTKAFLKEKYNKKPIPDAPYEIHQVFTGNNWKKFNFYHIEDTIEVRQRVKKDLEKLSVTEDNICKALYVINKSAKKSRDTKQEAYYDRKFSVVSRSKTRQKRLYEIKDFVIKKCLEDKFLELKGFHEQDEGGYLLFYVCSNGYSFHVPIQAPPKDIDYLGEIEGLISSNVNIKTGVTYTQAIELLERYIG